MHLKTEILGMPDDIPANATILACVEDFVGETIIYRYLGFVEPGGERASFGRVLVKRTERQRKDDEWYEAVADALQVIGKRWSDDTTLDEDAFVLAYADEVAQRPEHELPCAPCSSAAGEEIVHGILECPARHIGQP